MGSNEKNPKDKVGVDMNDEKVIMRAQDPNVRNKNFEEVELGYTKEEALKEASRCLHCKIPKCVEG